MILREGSGFRVRPIDAVACCVIMGFGLIYVLMLLGVVTVKEGNQWAQAAYPVLVLTIGLREWSRRVTK